MKYETQEPPRWKLGEFKSSADRRKKVLMVAAGEDDIASYGAHSDFIRWVACSDAPDGLSDDDLKDLAHSAHEEAMSFGLSHETFLRYFKTIRNRATGGA